MKTTQLITTAFITAILVASPMTAMAGKGKSTASKRPSTATVVLAPLSDPEIATLKWMREEEKLARDIYVAMSTKYPQKIFRNIAASEQKHFDAIGEKLVLYGIEDPALDAPGFFSLQELQVMYDDLLATGWISYANALGVGVAIEEEDIVDLAAALDGTTSRPLTKTYQQLLNASENHLRSFEKLLKRLNID
jgi:hypothetical protein